MQKDMLQEIQDSVRRKEIDKNFKESDINNLKPEIKQLQSEKGSKLRCASLFRSIVSLVCMHIEHTHTCIQSRVRQSHLCGIILLSL